MKYFIFFALIAQSIIGVVRDIFNYDINWDFVEYDIIAQGRFHDSGTSFKILQCGVESKIVFEKKPFNSIKS